MTMTPDNTRVIPGGSFTTLNGQPAIGMGSIMASAAAINPWAATTRSARRAPRRHHGPEGRRDAVYGTATRSAPERAFEGTFALDPVTGEIDWLNDCLGDTYDVAPAGPALQRSPPPRLLRRRRLARHQPARALAEGRRLVHLPHQHADQERRLRLGRHYGLLGTPTPRSCTGARTSPSAPTPAPARPPGRSTPRPTSRSSTAASSRASTAPPSRASCASARGPGHHKLRARLLDHPGHPDPDHQRGLADRGHGARLWGSAWDKDNRTLTYEVLRNNNTWVYTTTGDSAFWTCPRWASSTRAYPGRTYRYQVRITDPTATSCGARCPTRSRSAAGRRAPTRRRSSTTARATCGGSVSPRAARLDWAGFDDLTMNGGYTRGADGAIIGDTDKSTTFGGSDGFGATPSPIAGPDVFSVEAWFKTHHHQRRQDRRLRQQPTPARRPTTTATSTWSPTAGSPSASTTTAPTRPPRPAPSTTASGTRSWARWARRPDALRRRQAGRPQRRHLDRPALLRVLARRR